MITINPTIQEPDIIDCLPLMINNTIIDRAFNSVPEERCRHYFQFDMDDLYYPLSPDDQVIRSKDYYIAPFQESTLLNQIPEIIGSYEYFIMYRVKKDPDHPVPKKEHRFVPCRFD